MKLVDTSWWIEFIRPEGDVKIRQEVALALESGNVCWCDMIRLELQRASGKTTKSLIPLLEETIPLVETSRKVWDTACEFAAIARQKGKPVPNTDILIFAVARVHRLELCHKDRHFESLAGMVC